jgi:two-component system, cell cycle sensor histidine kinase and response regulator CckA
MSTRPGDLIPVFQTAFELLADPVTVQDPDYAIIYQNKAMREAFGSHLGEKCHDVYERRSTICEGCGLKAVMETGHPSKVLRIALLQNGSDSFWENACSPVLDEAGRVIAGVEVCRDIADRVSLEATFKETNVTLGQLTAQLEVKVAERTADLARATLYRDTIIDAIGDPLFVKDHLRRYALVNRAMCELLGRPRGQIIGRTDLDLFPEQEARAFQEFDELVRGTGREATLEETISSATGGARTVLVKKTCFTGAGGEPQIVGIIRDITERKSLEEQLRQAQKMEGIGMLAGGIAHDFNNLLTPILGGSDLLLLETQDADRAALLYDMQHAAERLRELTQRLLAFARKQVLELRPTDLCEVVRRFEPMLRRTFRENIRFVTMLAPGPQLVLADASQLEQVLLNLAVNAQDAMPDGGRLAIEVRSVMLDEEYAGSHPDIRPGPHVQLSVSDTGGGMDALTQARIFEPFFTTKAEGHGTGLGLSVVYGIIKQQGGSVTVQSEPGRGSTFTISMPVCGNPGPAADRGGPVPVSASARSQETILVLEDNDIARTTTCAMLRRLGYNVLSADGPQSCLSLAQDHEGPIHLLLTDVILRESTGPEVWELLRAGGRIPRVLFMSGYAGAVQDALSNSGGKFLQKPLSFSVLADAVRQALDPR